MIWSVITLYFNAKGLNYFQIAFLESMEAIMIIVLELPTGWISDKLGYDVILKISAVARAVSLLLIILAPDIVVLAISTIFSAIANACTSGADTALLYETLEKMNKKEEFSPLRAKIRGRQALIRILVRFVGPALYSFHINLPFVLSLGIYVWIMIMTFRYQYTPQKQMENEKEEKQKIHNSEIVSCIMKNKKFIIYSFLSAFILIPVSNYSQFVGPMLKMRGLHVKWLGIVLAASSLGDYLGTKLIIRTDKKKDRTIFKLFLYAVLISAFTTIGGLWNTVAGGIVGYFGITFFYSPFIILLGEEINDVIDNKYRATLLSVSNQFDELLSMLCNSVIGFTVDSLGFGLVYRYLGISGLFILLILFMYLRSKVKK